jgi:energy-coupling factor transporter ATP-binding protein EcfA2/ABC-type multidrug transport system permease subunit
VSELLDVLGLAGKLRDYYRSLSGGQRQRLSVALALIGRPKIAVLDEMTTGLDPQARRDTWELIEHIRDRGTTILLVTHFMEEAERLCDHVALIDHGRIVALDTPAGLTAQARGGKTVRFLPSAPFDARVLTELPEVSRVERDGQHVVVTGTGELVNAVLFALRAAGLEARDVRLDASTLEDAFVALTGTPARATRGTQGRSTGMSLHTLTAPRAPRAAFGKIVLNEARLAGRQPAGIVVGIGVSLLLLVIFGSIPVFQQTSARLGGLSAFEVYIPILISFSIGVLALTYLPGPLVSYREQGILRRLSTTPVPAFWVLAAQFVVQACLMLIAVFLLIGVSVACYGAIAPRNPGGLVLALVLAIAALFAIGLSIAAAARTSGAARAIMALAFYPLMFFSGLYVPMQILPRVFATISHFTPLGAAVQAIQDSMLGQFPPALPLLVMAAYAIVFGYLAKRFFRWE